MIFPRSNYKILCRIVREAAISRDQSLDVNQTALACGWNPTVILANLGFLRCIGILSTCHEKKIMISGIELANALSLLASEDEIKKCWRCRLFDSGALDSLFEWIQKCNGIDQTQYLNNVAVLYGRRISTENFLGIKRLTSILCELGILARQNGRVMFVADRTGTCSSAEENDPSASRGDPHFNQYPHQVPQPVALPQAPLHLHFHLDPDTSSDRIEHIVKNAVSRLQGDSGISSATAS
jgi:hypothetical protein